MANFENRTTVSEPTPVSEITSINLNGKGTWVQLAIETDEAASGGVFNVALIPQGLTKAVPILDSNSNPITINASNPYPVVFTNLSISKIVITPSAVAGASTYTASAVARDSSTASGT